MNTEKKLQSKQPEVFKKLNKKKKQKQRRGKEHLSFSDIDNMMWNNKGIDESKCRGR